MSTSTSTSAIAVAKLVEAFCTFKCIGQSTEDKELTLDLCQRYHIDTETRPVRAKKDILKEATAPIRQVISSARKIHTRETFAGIGDSRIIPVASKARWDEHMVAISLQFWSAVDSLIANYDKHLEAEEVRLNSTFKRSDYPAQHALREMFGFEYGIKAMARPDSIVLDELSAEEVARIRAEHEARLHAQVAEVESVAIAQGMDLLKDLADELSKEHPVIVDSEKRKGVVPKLREYLSRIPERNLTENPTLKFLHKQIDERLQLSTEMLREHKFVRQQTAAAAKSILSHLSGPGRRLDIEIDEPAAAATA